MLIDELIEEHPAWTFEAVDGIGHLLPLEAPEKYVDIVGRWATSPLTCAKLSRGYPAPRLIGLVPDIAHRGSGCVVCVRDPMGPWAHW